MGDLDYKQSSQTVSITGDGESIVADTLQGTVYKELAVHDEDVLDAINNINLVIGATTPQIIKTGEQAAVKTETVITGTTYTVPTAKNFLLTNWHCSFTFVQNAIFRFQKQTGGAGAWATLWTIALEIGGQGQSNHTISFPNGIWIGSASDQFRCTVEMAIANKGQATSTYCGIEV